MVERVVVDSLVVVVAQRDRVGEVGPSALGPGFVVVELAPGVGALASVGGAGVVSESCGEALGFGEQPGLAARGRGRLSVPSRTAGIRPALQARRRASPAVMVVPVSRWAAFNAPCSTVCSMVTTTVAALLGCRCSVGRCSRSSAKASPRRCAQSKPCRWSSPVETRIRLGAVIESITFRRIPAARAGIGEVAGDGAVLVVVEGQPGLLPGCFFFGADQLVLVGVHDDLVGLDCCEGAFGESAELVGVVALGLLDQGGFDLLALGVADTRGQVTSGLHDHRRVRRGHQPFVEGCGRGVVPGLQLLRQCHFPGCVGAGDGGGLGDPGFGAGEPGVQGGAGLVGGRDQSQLVGLQSPDRSFHLSHLERQPDDTRGLLVQTVQHCVHLGDAREAG